MIRNNNFFLSSLILLNIPIFIVGIGVSGDHATGHAGINSASAGYYNQKGKGLGKYDTKKTKKEVAKYFSEEL